MMLFIPGIVLAVLCGWALVQAFLPDDDRARIFAGGVGRFYNIVTIVVGAAGVYWLLVRPLALLAQVRSE